MLNSRSTAFARVLFIGALLMPMQAFPSGGQGVDLRPLTETSDFTTWTMYGSASAFNETPGDGFTHSRLRLTQPGIGSQGGAAFAPTTIELDFDQPFTFDFNFFTLPGTVLTGDGMTFVLTPDIPSSLVPSGGSNLGYGNSGFTSGLAFAIDTFNFSGEPQAPSIQILENGDVTPIAVTETGLPSLYDPSFFQWSGKLEYSPSGLNDNAGTLTGSIEQFTGNLFYTVSTNVDGSALHNTPLHYGFTAGNGLADDGHFVSSFKPVPIPAAAWLFGSGLAGVAALARRRKSS